jgi:protein PsiE
MQLKIAKLIKFIEQALLVLIAILTILATGEEVVKIYFAFSVQLADLLLLFIYTEVLGMIGIYFIINRIPITLPIFIAMTAISRLIVLQGKEMDMSLLLYEAAAILVLAIAVMVVRYKPVRTYNYHTDEE